MSKLLDNSGNRKYLTQTERTRFISAAGENTEQHELLCLMCVYTGARISEIIALNHDSIDIEENTVTLRTLKQNGKTKHRIVPLPPSFVKNLVMAFKLRNKRTRLKRLWTYGREHAFLIIKQTMTSAGITGIGANPRGLRHTFAIHAILSDVPITFVQKWLGHTSLATTSIYLDVTGEESQQVASKMW